MTTDTPSHTTPAGHAAAPAVAGSVQQSTRFGSAAVSATIGIINGDLTIAGSAGRVPAETRCTLPADPGIFEGRGEEWDCIKMAVAAAAETGRGLTAFAINGMGGLGKTTFVVHVAHRLKQMARFDWYLYVDLHAHTRNREPARPVEVLESLLTGVGIDASALPSELEARVVIWRAQTSTRRVLLVLDDAASTEQIRQLLPSGGQSLVLITSRRWLGDLRDAVHIELPFLPLDESRRMFVSLAPHAADEPDAVTDLVKDCAGLPLAIELLAAVLNQHQTWRVRDLADETTNSIVSVKAENHSVRAAFDLSYRYLDHEDQWLLRHLSLHPGGDIDWRAAIALAGLIERGLSERQALERLNALYANRLITETARRRFGMHDLIRQYAKGLVAPDSAGTHELALARLFAHYHDTVVRKAASAGPSLTRHTRPGAARVATTCDPAAQQDALTWFQTEKDNLLACVRHGAECDRNSIGCDLCGRVVALTSALAGFLRHNGPWDTAIRLHGTAVTIAGHRGDRHAQAIAFNDLGIMHRLSGDYVMANDALEHALRIFRDLGVLLGQANALHEMGVVANWQAETGQVDKVDRADMVLVEALGLYEDERVQDQIGAANAAKNLGVTRYLTGKSRQADALWESALAGYAAIGDILGMAEVRNYRGRLWLNTRGPSAARKEFDRAEDLAKQTRSLLEWARAMEGIGLCHAANSEVDEAERCLQQAWEGFAAITGAKVDLARVTRKLDDLRATRARNRR